MDTSNINSIIDKICSATHAARRSGLNIGTDFKDNYFCCASVEGNLIRTIDLEDKNAKTQLNTLLRDIYAITPATAAMNGAA